MIGAPVRGASGLPAFGARANGSSCARFTISSSAGIVSACGGASPMTRRRRFASLFQFISLPSANSIPLSTASGTSPPPPATMRASLSCTALSPRESGTSTCAPSPRSPWSLYSTSPSRSFGATFASSATTSAIASRAVSIAGCMLPVVSSTIATSSPASRRSNARSTNRVAVVLYSSSTGGFGGGTHAGGAHVFCAFVHHAFHVSREVAPASGAMRARSSSDRS